MPTSHQLQPFHPLPAEMSKDGWRSQFTLINHFLIQENYNSDHLLVFNTQTNTLTKLPCSSHIQKIIKLPTFGFATYSYKYEVGGYIKVWRATETTIEPTSPPVRLAKFIPNNDKIKASPDGRYLAKVVTSWEDKTLTAYIWLFDCHTLKETLQKIGESNLSWLRGIRGVFTGPTQITVIRNQPTWDNSFQIYDWDEKQQQFIAGFKREIADLRSIYPSPDGHRWLLKMNKSDPYARVKKKFCLLDTNNLTGKPQKIIFSKYGYPYYVEKKYHFVTWADNTILFRVRRVDIKFYIGEGRHFEIYDCTRARIYVWDHKDEYVFHNYTVTSNNTFFIMNQNHRNEHSYCYFTYPNFITPIDTLLKQRNEYQLTPFIESLDGPGKLPRPVQRIIQHYAFEPNKAMFYHVMPQKPDISLRSLPGFVKSKITRLESKESAIKWDLSDIAPAKYTEREKSLLQQLQQIKHDLKALYAFKQVYAHRVFKYLVPFKDVQAMRERVERVAIEHRELISDDILLMFKHIRDALDQLDPVVEIQQQHKVPSPPT